MNGHKVDKARLKEVENEVTRYMTENFSFSVLRFEAQVERLHCEESLLSTIFHCHDCGPSEIWLGKSHPTSAVMRGCGLWNMQGLLGPELSLDDAQRVIEARYASLEPSYDEEPRGPEDAIEAPRERIAKEYLTLKDLMM